MEIIIFSFLAFVFLKSNLTAKNNIDTSSNYVLPSKSFLQNLQEKYNTYIYSALDQWNVSIEPEIIIGMISTESSGNELELGDDGKSYGLMQIQQKAFSIVYNIQIDSGMNVFDSNIQNLYNANVNIFVGIGYLKYLMENEGYSLQDAIQAYNTGTVGTKAGTDYLNKVLSCKNILQS
jgi:soluble lytic murein transglycosylase-like protein